MALLHPSGILAVSPAVSLLVSCSEPAWFEISSEDGWQSFFLPYVVETCCQANWHHDVELSCLLSHDQEIQRLNAAYRNKDAPTNVLSFPLLEFEKPTLPLIPPFEYNQLGDVVLSFETVQRESLALGCPFRDHVAHLLVHGVLHLLGYDHESDEEAEVMEGLEVSILRQLGVASPYPAVV